MTATDPGRAIPRHIQDNHTARVVEQYGGDWEAFARDAERQPGNASLAAWARAQAAAAQPERGPVGRRSAHRETAAE
jgi:hypothetical protein